MWTRLLNCFCLSLSTGTRRTDSSWLRYAAATSQTTSRCTPSTMGRRPCANLTTGTRCEPWNASDDKESSICKHRNLWAQKKVPKLLRAPSSSTEASLRHISSCPLGCFSITCKGRSILSYTCLIPSLSMLSCARAARQVFRTGSPTREPLPAADGRGDAGDPGGVGRAHGDVVL